MYAERGNHIITQVTEHKAVLDTCKRLEKEGVRVTYLPVQQNGLIDLDQLRDAITDKTILISIMYANNEIGVVQPMEEIGKIAKEKGVLFHSDAVQAVGKIPVNVNADGIDVLSLTRINLWAEGRGRALCAAEKPARANYRADGRRRSRARHAFGNPERAGHRGLWRGLRNCQGEMPEECKKLAFLRDKLKDKLMNELDEVYINGTMEHHLPHNLNISFAYVEGESLLMGINEIAVSSGSACTSATLEPSYVLKALGAGDDLAHSSIRFGIGRFNTEEEVDYVGNKVIEVVKKLRELSPLYEMAKEGVDLSKVSWAAH